MLPVSSRPDNRLLTRTLGSILYEAPSIYTGLASAALISAKLQNWATKPCHEHFHGRQNGGLALVQLLAQVDQIAKSQVGELCYQYCQVHYTTPEENKRLRQHQKKKCSSQAAYNRAGITLIPCDDLFSRKNHTPMWKKEMYDKYNPLITQPLSTGVIDQSITEQFIFIR